MPYRKVAGIPQCREAGVYSITNTRNGKVYIGSATCIRGRLMAHRRYLRIGKHDNSYLQRAWNKYGEAAFKYDVVETCEVGNLISKEQYWMDSFNSYRRMYGYNLAPKAGGTRGYKHSAESRKRGSEAQKKLGRDMRALSLLAAEVNRGKTMPPEIRQKISDATRGVPKGHGASIKATHWTKNPGARKIIESTAAKLRGRKHSLEHRWKISEGNRRRWARIKAEEGLIHATTA